MHMYVHVTYLDYGWVPDNDTDPTPWIKVRKMHAYTVCA